MDERTIFIVALVFAVQLIYAVKLSFKYQRLSKSWDDLYKGFLSKSEQVITMKEQINQSNTQRDLLLDQLQKCTDQAKKAMDVMQQQTEMINHLHEEIERISGRAPPRTIN